MLQSQDITTVIIPTLANRPQQLARAIASVHRQQAAPAVPLVVVNGQEAAPECIRALERRKDIRLVRTPVGGVSNARLLGLRHVDSPLFAFLDDDDELLPDATGIRNGVLVDGRADVAATNGWCQFGNERTLCFDYARNTFDAARDLLEGNWMHSAGASYSTERIPSEIFENLGDYMEITGFALRLSLRFRVARVDIPTFVVHEDAVQRVSKSRRYLDAIPAVLQQMHMETGRPDLRRLLARLRAAALHDCSHAALSAADLARAWRLHLASLVAPGGLQYVAYSRHILRAAVASLLGKLALLRQ